MSFRRVIAIAVIQTLQHYRRSLINANVMISDSVFIPVLHVSFQQLNLHDWVTHEVSTFANMFETRSHLKRKLIRCQPVLNN
jgi:hypothetical protein